MAADAEQQGVPTNEQTPLLNDHLSNHSFEDQVGDDSERVEPKSISWYVWRVFWAIVAILVLALFIKGWVDAGADVDVC